MSKNKQTKPRFDLWILSQNGIRLVEASLTQKQCHKIVCETEVNNHERFIMTPVCQVAYCPLLTKV
jgi:hypothetical protein